MSTDKKYKKLLYDYKINPSQKSWERIEEALGREEKKPAVWLIYTKWSAAASIALMITAYAIYQKVPMKADVANAITIQQNNVASITQNTEKNETISTKIIDNQPLESIVINNKEITTAIKKELPQTPQIAQIKPSIEQEDKNFEAMRQRNTFSIVSLPMANLSALSYESQVIEPKNLPQVTKLSPDEQRINKKWNQLVMEEINEEADSTITEKALFVANKKTVAFLQSNIKPTLISWFKLRKGF